MKNFHFYCFLLLILLSTDLFAQNNWEVQISPRPYEGKAHYGNNVSTPVKKVIIISQRLQNQFMNDTLSIINYNNKGLTIENISFDKGKPYSKSIYRYDTKSIYLGITQESFKKSGVNSYSKIGYNKNKIRSTEYNCSIRNNDTIQRTLTKYIYNNDNQLIARENYFKNELTLKDEYTYTNKLLTSRKSFGSPYNVKRYSEVRLNYSPANLLSDEIDLNINDSKIDTTSIVHYLHTNEKLTEQNLMILGSTKRIINTKYTYDSNNDLESIFATRDSDILNVKYTYNLNRKLVLKKATINTPKTFAECPIIANLYGMDPKKAIDYQEEYSYDKSGNIIEAKYKLNDDLIAKTIFILEYFDQKRNK
jgi:hypothetical protein